MTHMLMADQRRKPRGRNASHARRVARHSKLEQAWRNDAEDAIRDRRRGWSA